MGKVRGIYEGFIALSFMFFVAASFIAISLLGLCTADWLPRNLIIGGIAEVVLFIWGIKFLKEGTIEIYNETNSPRLVKELYIRVLYLMLFSILFSLILIIFPYGILSSDGERSNGILFYTLNIAVPALFFLIWMSIGIRKINKQMEK